MKLLALAIVAALAYAAGRAREYRAWMRTREEPDPADDVQPDPADDVQPADPVTLGPGTWVTPRQPYYGTGDYWPQPWVNTSTGTLEPLTAADRDWLDQTVRSSLHPST